MTSPSHSNQPDCAADSLAAEESKCTSCRNGAYFDPGGSLGCLNGLCKSCKPSWLTAWIVGCATTYPLVMKVLRSGSVEIRVTTIRFSDQQTITWARDKWPPPYTTFDLTLETIDLGAPTRHAHTHRGTYGQTQILNSHKYIT